MFSHTRGGFPLQLPKLKLRFNIRLSAGYKSGRIIRRRAEASRSARPGLTEPPPAQNWGGEPYHRAGGMKSALALLLAALLATAESPSPATTTTPPPSEYLHFALFLSVGRRWTLAPRYIDAPAGILNPPVSCTVSLICMYPHWSRGYVCTPYPHGRIQGGRAIYFIARDSIA